ncbi:uncharacterized protein LOC113205304 isoform X1 [Frankliniella occidentalis]|uniref:Uncharacterized protein LOC113205304 isoform X1 n=1 Tax=Frankliniella occidentalis TaxID=133901 RepID=A0A9C6WWA2_FRAOC|nr:uncharacterized protein LOC113205304 isoform X1 [Frankliniella occidentalis]
MATSSNIPYPGRKFTSWCDVEKCLDAYGEEKWFAWSIAHSSSIESANLNLKARGETALYDPKLKHKNVILTCTCGGVKRINNGKGLRCHQSTWKTGCRVEVHLKASKTELVVDKFEPEHNHRCDEKFFSALPKIRRRRLQDPKVRATTELLFKAGVKPCKIRSLLRSMDCGQIQQRDLANERARWKKEGLNGKTPEEKLAESLQKLLDADPGAFIYIGKDKDNNLEYLFIQTSAQRKVMEDFGEVLLLDHTYKINRNRMPVTVLMAMDGHGDGRAVGYAFIANEKSSTIGEVLSAFKTSITSAVADRIQTVVVDKDYSEVKAIKLVLPNVNIQLCDFHVSRTFKSTTKAEKPEVKTIITNMRYCSSSSDLAKLVKDLTVLATEQFMKYFKKNWLSCPMAWTFRDRSKSLNLGNNTNNRLENHNSKVKMMLHHNHELYEALDNLLELVQNKEDDVIFRNTIDQVKEAYFMHSTDPIVQSLVKDLTRFAAKLILEELNRTVSAEEVKRFCATEKECLCPHWACYLLPCRHMFSVRRQKGLQVCCTGKINKRWWKTQYHEIVTSDEPECRVFQRVVPKLMPRTTNERYTHSMLKAKAICEVMSESSEKQYSSRYANLEALLQFYSEGKEVAILEILPSSAINLNATTALTILEGEHHVISETPNGKETATVVTPEEISVNSAVHNQTQGTATLTVLEEEQVISVTPIEKETATAVTSGETSVISAVDNSTPVRANSRIEQSFSKPATTLNMTEVQPIAPVCFCGISCIRLVSQPTSRWPNNPFYKCSTNTCRFWQPAKKSKKSLVQSQDIQHTIDYSDLLNCNEPDAIAELVNAIDELENMDETNEKNKDDQLILDNADTTSQNICHGSIEVNLEVNANEATAKKTNGEKEFVSNGQIVSGNVVAEDEVDDEATLNTNGTVDVFQALKGIVLPQPVKQKGRPQGLGKTTFNWTKKTSKPRGFVMRSLEKGPVQTRKDNGLKIPDSDVTKESESEWSVTSQSKGSSDIYRVSKSQTPFCHLCVGTECIHIWACECHDYKFRSTVCKHIHKVMDLDKKSNDKSVTVGHRLSLERSTCGKGCMMVVVILGVTVFSEYSHKSSAASWAQQFWFKVQHSFSAISELSYGVHDFQVVT